MFFFPLLLKPVHGWNRRCQISGRYLETLQNRVAACSGKFVYPAYYVWEGVCRKAKICWDIGMEEPIYEDKRRCEDECLDASSCSWLRCSACYTCSQGDCIPDFNRVGCYGYQYPSPRHAHLNSNRRIRTYASRRKAAARRNARFKVSRNRTRPLPSKRRQTRKGHVNVIRRFSSSD